MNPLNSLFDELQDSVNDCQADVSKLHDINLERVNEEVDNTDLSGELACAGGVCEITSL